MRANLKDRNRIDKCNNQILLRPPKNKHYAEMFALLLLTPLVECWGKLLFKKKKENRIGLIKCKTRF